MEGGGGEGGRGEGEEKQQLQVLHSCAKHPKQFDSLGTSAQYSLSAFSSSLSHCPTQRVVDAQPVRNRSAFVVVLSTNTAQWHDQHELKSTHPSQSTRIRTNWGSGKYRALLFQKWHRNKLRVNQVQHDTHFSNTALGRWATVEETGLSLQPLWRAA